MRSCNWDDDTYAKLETKRHQEIIKKQREEREDEL